MSRPSKATAVLGEEKRSHRTKAELRQRAAAENALITGKKMRERPEVKDNEKAHKEWQRIRGLLEAAGKNEALYEATINRYCMLHAECLDFEHKRQLFSDQLDELTENTELEATDRYKYQAQMQKNILAVDKQLQTKRRMMLDIEKECAMTISAAMRSIPKTTAEPKNPLMGILNDDDP